MIPLVAAAIAGLGTFLVLKTKDKASTGLNAPKALADFAAARNADNERIRAANAQAAANGFKPAGDGPREVVATNLLRTTNADPRTFAKVSPAGFLGIATSDMMSSQLFKNDLVSVDVAAAGLVSSEIPSGNMAFQCVTPPSGGMVGLVSVDPRVDNGTVVQVALSAITDFMTISPDSANNILGFGQ